MWTPKNDGQFIRVGVVDSLYHPDEHLSDAYMTNRRENYIHTETSDTTGHGGDVLETVGYFAPNAEFNLYRVIAETGQARRGDLVQAIADANQHGLDFLNLSVGIAHHEEENYDCGGQCRIAEETRLAINDGLTIVAAAGNRTRDASLAVNCPARVTNTICVGGLVSRCTASLVEGEESGQYWVRNDGIHGPFCGQRDCSQARSCSDHRYEKPWMGNVSFHNATPAVVAPVHHPSKSSEAPVLQSGTSFATPIVCGLLAAIAGDLLEKGINPSPSEFHTAVVNGAAEIDEGDIGKFQAGATWDHLIDDQTAGNS